MIELIEIMFDDLSEQKQAEIIEKLGNNGNFDIYPITHIPYIAD